MKISEYYQFVDRAIERKKKFNDHNPQGKPKKYKHIVPSGIRKRKNKGVYDRKRSNSKTNLRLVRKKTVQRKNAKRKIGSKNKTLFQNKRKSRLG